MSRATGSDVMCVGYAIVDVEGDGDGEWDGVQLLSQALALKREQRHNAAGKLQIHSKRHCGP